MRSPDIFRGDWLGQGRLSYAMRERYRVWNPMDVLLAITDSFFALNSPVHRLGRSAV